MFGQANTLNNRIITQYIKTLQSKRVILTDSFSRAVINTFTGVTYSIVNLEKGGQGGYFFCGAAVV